jgi:hypothetical protein
MTTYVVIDDKYDALSQFQEPISSMETEGVEGAGAAEETQSKEEFSAHTAEIFSRLQGFGDEICAKLHQPPNSTENDNKDPSDGLSWSSYHPTLQDNITIEDQSSATTWLRARKDRYVTINDTPVSTIGSNLSTEEKQETEARDNLETKTEEAPSEENRDDESQMNEAKVEVDHGNDTANDEKAVIAATGIICKPDVSAPLESKATEDQFMDARLTVSFREDELSSEEEDSEKRTNGALDKYSMAKDVNAFESLLNKLGLTRQDTVVDSNHTRTTASSTLLDSVATGGNLSAVLTETSHSRKTTASGSVSLDPVFTLNSSATSLHSRSVVSMHSKSTAWAIDQGASQFCQLNFNANNDGNHNNDNDDESTWFGFRENMHPTVAVLLAPVSSSYTAGTSTKYETDFDEDESLFDDDEKTEALTAAIQSVEDSDLVLRSDPSDLLTSSASMTAADDDVVFELENEDQLFVDADFADMIWKMSELLTPQCINEVPFDDEFAFQASNDSDEEGDEHTQLIVDNDSVAIHGIDEEENDHPNVEENQLQANFFLWQLVSPNCNAPEEETEFCCSCSTSRAGISTHSSIVEDEEPQATAEEKKAKQTIAKMFIGCKERKGNKSDEEGEGGISIMVDYNSEATKNEFLLEDQEVEILLNDHLEMVAEMESVLQEITEINGCPEIKQMPRKFSFDLTVIEGDENECSEQMSRTEEREFSSGDSFSIDGVPSNDSLCIPAPPKQGDKEFVSPLESVSCDSSVLSYSSDDMHAPVVLRDLTRFDKDSSSHHRRHTLDNIPSYQQLLDLEKPVILPFLLDKITGKEDSFHTAKTTASASSIKSIEALHIQDTVQNINNTQNQSSALVNDATHPRNEPTFLSIWTDICADENVPHTTNESGRSSRRSSHARFSPKPPLSCKANRGSKKCSKTISTKADPSPKMVQKDPVLTVKPIKSILRKEGTLGSGRRIHWNEEQLQTKEEKGILFYSGREDPRSVCPLDKLVLEITEINNDQQ